MKPIKPKTDNKPGQKTSGRFKQFVEPITQEEPQAPVSTAAVSELSKPTTRPFTEGQPIRLDRSLWLRLKMLKLQQEGRGVKTTLMELLDTAVEEYLTRNGH